MAFEELPFPRMFQIRQTFEAPPPVDPDDSLAAIRPYENNDLGIVRIKTIMDLETIAVSAAYLKERQCLDSIAIVGASRSLDSGARGMIA